MIGKVIEGRYAGASVNRLPDRNVLFVQTEDGSKIALSKKNAISIDDVTDQYPSYGRKVMMVMWNDYETSIIQFGVPHEQTVETKSSGDNDITASTTPKTDTNKQEKGRGPSRKGIFVAVLAILILVAIIAVKAINNSPEVIMNCRISEFDRRYKLDGGTDTVVYLWTAFNNDAKDDGLSPWSDYPIDVEFIKAYAQVYSIEDFINRLYVRWDEETFYCRNALHNDTCYEAPYTEALLKALEIAEIDLIPWEIPPEGTNGYYTEHPEEIPESRTREVSGEFYNSSGENRNTQTRTCQTTVTVHGDFVIEHYDGYSYDKGEYGWVNGEFRDELPSWKREVYDMVYFKGKHIYQDIEGAEIFYVGDILYVLYKPETNKYYHYEHREWEMLG